MNSKRKGCAGEREFAALCREHGIDSAARGQQFPREAIKYHCMGVAKCYMGVAKAAIPSNGGKQLARVIPEKDIYRMAFRSSAKGAEAFQGCMERR